MSALFRNKLPRKIPLLIVLVTLFVTLNVLAVGLVGYLSFRNGQRAVNDVAYQLRSEITTRIKEHLSTFLNTPYQINQLNANALRQGMLAANDAAALERHFWEQIQVFDSVSSIYFGNTEGGLVDAGREGVAGSLYVITTDGFVSGPFKKYATDSRGQRTDLLVTVPGFDARTRPWYIGAISKDGVAWSAPYILFTGQDMAIAASRPVYNEQQELLGVVSVDLFLSNLSHFLQSFKIGQMGQGFIMERSGLLVASSAKEKPFTEPGKNKAQRRLYANESTIPLIRDAAEALAKQFGDYRYITETQYLKFEIDGQRQFLQVSPIKSEDGPDWLIVVVIPEADFMAQINANNRVTIFLIIATLIIAVATGIVATRKIIGPMLQLNAFAYALSKGEWGQAISYDSRISEISALTSSFNHMAGQLQQMVAELTTEVAEREQAEEALKESEAKLNKAQRVAKLGHYIFNVKTGYWTSSDELDNIFEIDKNYKRDINGWLQITHPDFTEIMADYLQNNVLRQHQKFDKEYKIISEKTQQEKWVHGLGDLKFDDQNNPIEMFGTIHDITERKRADEALRESEENLRITLNSIGDAVITTDTNGTITGINPVAETLTGWKQKEALGRALTEVFQIINDQTREPAQNPVEKVLKAGKVVGLANHTALIAKDGTEYQISDSGAPIQSATGSVTGVVLVFRDVTAKLRAEQELLKARKLESVGVLAGGIAHDFNNLLTGLFGNIELAKTFLPADHKSHKFLESAGRSMESATNLTKQLLTFAKGGDPIKEILSIGAVITETAQFSMRGSNVKLQTNIAPDLWSVEADKGQLSQVIGNLVINAQQAMPTGGTITIVATNVETSAGKYVQITVQDKGVGIAAQYLDKIFDPYFSTKQKGSGLGLASTHSIISKHNGAITVDSHLNQGTIFTIHLPATEEKPAGKPAADAYTANAFSARILVLDDEEMVRDVIGAMLEELGHKVTFAVDGQEAIVKYQTSWANNAAYDIVITDLTIPGGMGGQETAQEILRINPQAKIIVSSGYATDPVMANYKDYGFKDRAVKPYHFANLQKVIQRTLET